MLATEEEYSRVLMRIEALMDAEDGTPEGNELDRLVSAAEAYEDENYPMGMTHGQSLTAE